MAKDGIVSPADLHRWDSKQNRVDLAKIVMSETSARSQAEALAVAFTVLNRMKRNEEDNVSDVWSSAFAHNQDPNDASAGIVEGLFAGKLGDNSQGATHFYSPQSMPREGDDPTGYDVGGGLEQTAGLSSKNYRPSWAITYPLVQVEGIEPKRFKFYRALGIGPISRPSVASTVRGIAGQPPFRKNRDKLLSILAEESNVLAKDDPDPSLPQESKMGGGFNTFTNSGLQGIPIKPGGRTFAPTGHKAVYDIKYVETFSDLRDAMSLHAFASYSGLLFSAGASADWFSSRSVTRYSVYLVARVYVDLGSTLLNDFELTDEAAGYLNARQPMLSRFYERFGDSFVAGYRAGGELVLLYEFSAQTEQERSDLALQVQGSVGSFSAGADFKSKLDSFSSTTSKNLWVYRVGGNEPPPGLDADKLIAFALGFEKDVTDHADVLEIFTRSYPAAKGYPNQMGDVFSESRDAYNELAGYLDQLRLCKSDIGYVGSNAARFTQIDSSLSDRIDSLTSEVLYLAKRLTQEPYADSVKDVPNLAAEIRSIEAILPRWAPMSYSSLAGPPDGTVFDDGKDGLVQGSREISEIYLSYGAVIDGLQVFYRRNGAADYTPGFHGGRGGNSDTIMLAAGEYIISVSGMWGPTPNYGTHIYCLRIQTNRGRVFGPYGNRQYQADHSFDLTPGGKIFALQGYFDRYINSLAVAYCPV